MIEYQGKNTNGSHSSFSDLSLSPALSDDLRRYVGLLWHWSWLLLLATVLGGLIGYLSSSRQTPVYQASATMWISESRTLNEYANILASERLAQTYAQLMIQQPVLEGVLDQLDLDINPALMKGRVTVTVIEDTQLLLVTVEDTSPVQAAQIANTIGEVFARINQSFQTNRYADSKTTLSAQLAQVDQQIQDANQQLADLSASITQTVNEDGTIETNITVEQQRERDRLETNLALYQQIYANLLQSYESVRLAEIQSTSSVNLVEQAIPPLTSIRPNVFQDSVLGVFLGFIFGIGLIFLIDILDDTVKGPADVARHLDLPVLGYISRLDTNLNGPIAALEPRSPISEAFRALRTNIQYASVDRPISRILVTSPTPQDGKSTVATNLGVVISQSGRKVTIVDADMRRPSQHKRLKLANRVGLSDLFVQEHINLDGAMRETRVPGMYLITSGGLPPNPSELVGSEKMMEVLRVIRQHSDIVIVDTPPVMAVTDAAALAPRMDGVLIVVRPGATKLAQTKHTVETLRRGGANILGIVLNDIDHNRSRYYYYYQGYYTYDSYYGEGVEPQRKQRKVRRKKVKETTAAESDV